MLGFRVWDIGRKEFCDEWFMDQNGNVGDIESARWNPLEFHEKYIPMQSTGLRDCNNKEIFVGDILKVDRKFNNEIQKDEFFIVDDSFDLHYHWELSLEDLSVNVHSMEIIGNRFENPELLEKINARI